MRRTRTISAVLLSLLLLLQSTGCSTFRLLQHQEQAGELVQQRNLRVKTADGIQYFFPRGQYRIETEAGTRIPVVKGWGDKSGTYGLIDRGFFEVRLDSETTLEREEIDVVRSVLFSGVLVGVTVLTYHGVRALVSTSGRGSTSPAPPPAN